MPRSLTLRIALSLGISVAAGLAALYVAYAGLASADIDSATAQDLILAYGWLVGILVVVSGTAAVHALAVRPMRALFARMERFQRKEAGPAPETFKSPRGGNDVARLSQAFDELVARVRDHERKTERAAVEQREALRRLEEAQEQLVRSEKLAAVGILTAGIAHEIGNPINIVLGYLTLLDDDELTMEMRRKYIEMTRVAAERVSGIIHDLLAFSSPGPESQESDRLASARPCIEQTLRLLEPQARFRGVTVDVQSPDGELAFQISPRRLEQILVNLLLNAADAMGESSETRDSAQTPPQEARVQITYRRIPAAAGHAARGLLEVRDWGPGLDASAQTRIFDPFFTTKRSGKGTGLGLSICKRIAEAFDGDLSVVSEPGQGACFRLELPISE